MLLTVDIGNTNITLGLFENEKYSKEIGDIAFYKYANKTFEKKAEAGKEKV